MGIHSGKMGYSKGKPIEDFTPAQEDSTLKGDPCPD